MTKANYESLEKIRNSLEDILAKMLQAKKEAKANINMRDLLTEASVMFVDLRQVNRLIFQEEDRVKSETEAAKLPVDHTTLQLHNLLYEKNYYLKAIKACKDFKSKYPDIDLVSEKEFFRDAPDELKSDPSLKEDAHKLNLQRLNYELHQRKELCKQREQLEARKKLLQEGIQGCKKFLSSLPGHLKTLKKASLPVQQHLGILHTKRAKQHQLAELLPSPLYILYTQFLSQKEAFGEFIELEILGSARDAQTVARQQASREAAAPSGPVEETKPDEDLHEEEDDSQRRRKRAKTSHDKESLDGPGLYQTHPLTVLLQVYDDEQPAMDKANKLLAVSFEYLPKLNVVCAGVDGTASAPDSTRLLANLFPNDTGLDLPNQVSKLQAGVGFVFDEKRGLRPYKWAQHVAGIDFLPEIPPLLPESVGLTGSESAKGSTISSALATYRQQHRVHTILQLLRSRKKAHLALKEQLESLSKLKQTSLKSNNFPWTRHTSKCVLKSWIEMESSGFDHQPYALAAGDLQPTPTGTSSKDGLVFLASSDMETGREDGELPSTSGLPSGGAGSVGSKLSSWKEDGQDDSGPSVTAAGSAKEVAKSVSRGSTVGEKRSRRGEKIATTSKPAVIQLEDAILAAIRPSLLPSLDALMEDGMDGMEADSNVLEETEDDAHLYKSSRGWEMFGVERYRAILRREGGPHGKRIELEAQVEVSPEYPLRPPVFRLKLLPPGPKDRLTMPAGPPGLLDVTESMVIGEAHVDEWFNELRALEAKVNIHLPSMVPKVEANYLLSHQLALLVMLYDQEVDFQASSVGAYLSGPSPAFHESSASKVGSRLIRGRDRRKVLAWHEHQGIFDHHP